MKRLGSQTVKFQAPPLISAHAAVGSVMEGQGPLCAYFDFISNDPYFGAKSWERAESEMLKKCFGLPSMENLIDSFVNLSLSTSTTLPMYASRS